MGVTGYDLVTGTFTPQEGDSVWNQLEVSDLGICQQSDCHNGILVNGPGEGVPLNAPHVSDDQVLECLWNHSTGGDDRWRYPSNWVTARDMLRDLAIFRESGSLNGEVPGRLVRFGKWLDAALQKGGYWAIVGGGHWRALAFTNGTAYLFDPYGGWDTSGVAKDIQEALKRIQQATPGANAFKTYILNIRVQDDAFQCGVWVVYLGCVLWEYAGSQAATSTLDFRRYVLDQMKQVHILQLNPQKRDTTNAPVALQLRVYFRAYCSNPRYTNEPPVGQYSRPSTVTVSINGRASTFAKGDGSRQRDSPGVLPTLYCCIVRCASFL